MYIFFVCCTISTLMSTCSILSVLVETLYLNVCLALLTVVILVTMVTIVTLVTVITLIGNYSNCYNSNR